MEVALVAFVKGWGLNMGLMALAGGIFCMVRQWRSPRHAPRRRFICFRRGAAHRRRCGCRQFGTELAQHAFLDMTVIFGGISAQLSAPARTPFALGGITMSFVWFFALGYGAHRCAPLLNNPHAWRLIINGAVALMMFGGALSLLWLAANG